MKGPNLKSRIKAVITAFTVCCILGAIILADSIPWYIKVALFGVVAFVGWRLTIYVWKGPIA